MHNVTLDHAGAIIDYQLSGRVKVEEMEQLVRKVQEAAMEMRGRAIKIQADLRGFKPASEEVADMIRDMQAFALRSGVTRIAEIIGSGVVALQLGRVARESGADKILRRFSDDESARQWLSQSDPESSRR